MFDGAELPLLGRGALITGAGRGIGRAITERLARLGATALCVSRTLSDLQETVRAAGPRASALAVDLSTEAGVRATIDAALTRAPSLDILVHCAGVMTMGAIELTSLEDFDRAFAIDVRAAYALTQAAIPALKASRGQVLFINSSVIRAANTAGRGVYAATQTALKSLADSLRDEVNDFDIRVTSIMPGVTATTRTEQLFSSAGKPYQPELLLQPADVAELAACALLLPRTSEATDLHIRPMRKS